MFIYIFSKLVGCERCMIEFGCEVERKDVGGFQAYYRCEHGKCNSALLNLDSSITNKML